MNSPRHHRLVSIGRRRISKWLILSAGTILCVTGFAKVWSALGSAQLLDLADPVLGVRFRWLMLIVGMAELAVGFACFVGRTARVANTLLTWITSNFLLYRLGLWWLDWKIPCPCLGNITDALSISPAVADTISKALLGYLIVASYTLLILDWSGRSEVRASLSASRTCQPQ